MQWLVVGPSLASAFASATSTTLKKAAQPRHSFDLRRREA